MPVTSNFFIWFLYGRSAEELMLKGPGLGGWVFFLTLALAAVIWILYNSGVRRLPALGWRMGVIFTALLILPVILYRFTTSYEYIIGVPGAIDPSPLGGPYREVIFYLGVLGGLLPVILSVGYFVTYQGMVGCPQGHVYEAALGQCPYDAPPPAPAPMPHSGVARPSVESMAPLPGVKKRHVHAWLVTNSGKDYQLYEHETTIGRSQQNDIYLVGDSTVGRQHAKIIEQNGHFRLIDLGARNFTRVNGRIVREPVLLDPDDEIQFGDNTTVRFVTTRR